MSMKIVQVSLMNFNFCLMGIIVVTARPSNYHHQFLCNDLLFSLELQGLS